MQRQLFCVLALIALSCILLYFAGNQYPYSVLQSDQEFYSLIARIQEHSYAEVPTDLRQQNYAGGSCVHAAMVTSLRMQGQDEVADWWKQEYRGGESLGGLVSKANSVGLEIAYTGKGEEDFLEWCDSTRRPAVIFYYPNHAVNFAGYKDGYAILIDNNKPSKNITIPKDEFLQNWKRYGGVALTPVYTPLSPTPFI